MSNADDLIWDIQQVQEKMNQAKFFLGNALGLIEEAQGSLLVLSLGTNNRAPKTAVNLVGDGKDKTELAITSLFNAGARLEQWIEDL